MHSMQRVVSSCEHCEQLGLVAQGMQLPSYHTYWLGQAMHELFAHVVLAVQVPSADSE